MSRKIAYAGMLLAVDTVLFLMVNVFQTNTIFLLGLASLPIAIVIMNLKLSYANITLVVLYFIIRQFIVIPQKWYLVILFEVVFLVYDYVYSLFIDYYNEKLNKYFK